jgi:hypothetical protein
LWRFVALVKRLCTSFSLFLSPFFFLMTVLRIYMRKYHDHEKHLSWDFDWFTIFQQPLILKSGLQIRLIYSMYRENFYSLPRVHGSALHGGRCTVGREADADFAIKSICLMADNIRNEVLTIHISQEVLKMPSSLHFAINCFVKNHRNNTPSCTNSTPDTNFHWMTSAIVLQFLH